MDPSREVLDRRGQLPALVAMVMSQVLEKPDFRSTRWVELIIRCPSKSGGKPKILRSLVELDEHGVRGPPKPLIPQSVP